MIPSKSRTGAGILYTYSETYSEDNRLKECLDTRAGDKHRQSAAGCQVPAYLYEAGIISEAAERFGSVVYLALSTALLIETGNNKHLKLLRDLRKCYYKLSKTIPPFTPVE